MAAGASVGIGGGLCAGLEGETVRAVGGGYGEGEVVALGYLDEYSPQAVQRFLEPLLQRLGGSVIITNDLMSYSQMAERLELGHQVCHFHVRRWVNKALRELKKTLPEEWQGVLEEIKQLIMELPADGHKRLYTLWKQTGMRLDRKRGNLHPSTNCVTC